MLKAYKITTPRLTIKVIVDSRTNKIVGDELDSKKYSGFNFEHLKEILSDKYKSIYVEKLETKNGRAKTA